MIQPVLLLLGESLAFLEQLRYSEMLCCTTEGVHPVYS
uniref:Uncharacterized protein n=1 Tax=Anguilla anguilla TaxID=7936 RepID=A0A0E9S8J1_ANGAN